MSVQAITCAMALRGVSPSEKLLLLALANYADERMQCWPSQRRLAEDTCLTDRTVRALLAKLEREGTISRTERTREDNSRSTDIVTLHFAGVVMSPASGGAEIISGGVRKPLPGGAETASGHEPSLNHQPEPTADPDGFAAWWEAYPRKSAKGAARKAYKAALKKAKPEVLLASLVAHRFSPEARYQPHPATWLNGECWADASAEPSRPDPPSADPWPNRLTRWRAAAYWNSEWGPRPGKPGYRGPPLALGAEAA